jgi:hypothetical protein
VRYLCLLIAEPAPDVEVPVPGSDEFAQMMAEFQSATAAMAESGVLVDSGPLRPSASASMLRVRGGKTQVIRQVLGAALLDRIRLAAPRCGGPIRLIPEVTAQAKRESALSCGGCEQAQGASGLDRFGPAVRAEFGVQVAQVGLDGARRYGQLAGDLRR